MKGPYDITHVGNFNNHHHIIRREKHEKDKVVIEDRHGHARTTRSKYRSNDGSLVCELISTMYEDGVGVGLFTINALKGKEKLLEMMKEKKIADDFPITRETTKEEAVELLEKLLGDC